MPPSQRLTMLTSEKISISTFRNLNIFRKKVLAYSSNATGTAKLEEITAAYVEIIEDFQQKALQQGSEDPACAEILQKCEELLPGQV